MSKPHSRDNVRTMPHCNENEAAVLGSILLDNSAMDLVLGLLQPESFYRESNRKIYTAMLNMYRAGAAIDTTTLLTKLHDDPDVTSVGGVHYLIGLTNKVPSAVNIVRYAHNVRGQANLRRQIRTMEDEVVRCYETQSLDSADIDTLLSQIDQRAETVAHTRLSQGLPSTKPSVAVKKAMDNAVAISQGRSARWRYGIGALDDLTTRGREAGQISCLAARPSVGKSAAALQTCISTALMKEPCVYYSIEDSDENIGDRIGRRRHSITADDIKSGLQEMHVDMMMNAQQWAEQQIDKYMTIVDHPSAKNFSALYADLWLRIRNQDIGLAVIDYLTLLTPDFPHMRNETRSRKIGEMTAQLKALAKKSKMHGRRGCHIVIACQLNRDSARGVKPAMPGLTDLRDSGEIEQDLDLALFLHRPDLSEGKMEILIAKQRSGEAGRVVGARFNGRSMRIDDAAYQHEEALAEAHRSWR